MNEPPRIVFPVEYPIKVVARNVPALRAALDAVFVRIAGETSLAGASERLSAEGRFISVTYVIEAQNEEHISQLFAALRELPDVMMVL
jgi:hypothetical protein